LLVGAALGGAVVATSLTAVLTLAGGARPNVTPAAASGPREGPAKARPAPARQVTIGWVGDTILGSRYGLPPRDGRELLRPVREALTSPDLMVGNLEGTLSVGGVPKCGTGVPNCFAFQAPPSHAETLRWAGFDVLNLANNHAFDYGAAGQMQTLAALDERGVRHTGRPGHHAGRARGRARRGPRLRAVSVGGADRESRGLIGARPQRGPARRRRRRDDARRRGRL
jgi:hypothetical protein